MFRRSKPRPISRAQLNVEALESREVPATMVNATTLTYQDFDGDDVKVVFSKPILNAGMVNAIALFNTGNVNGSNAIKQQLQLINIPTTAANVGINVTVTATPNAVHGGDGCAAVGRRRPT